MIVKRPTFAYLAGLLKNDVTAQVLLGALGEGVVAINSQATIVFVNKRAEEMFGFQAEELIGSPLNILLPERFSTRHVRHVKRFFADPHTRGMGSGLDLFGRRKDSTEFPLEIGLSFLCTEEGLFALAFVTDITRRKRYEHDLMIRNEELDAFAHTVAHDLNGALTPLIGLSQLLAETCETLPPQAMKRDLETIAQSGLKMSDIIKNLLLFASMRKEDVVFNPLNMKEIVEETLHRLQHIVKARRAEIIVPETFPSVLGFAPWVEEVWFNYLSNGLKYGGEPPRLEIGYTEEGENQTRFWVKDNGAGISAEEKAKLFIPLSQLEHPSSKGYGLGLSIVQRIVHKLSGEVRVESEPGKGSVFSFTLRSNPLTDNGSTMHAVQPQ